MARDIVRVMVFMVAGFAVGGVYAWIGHQLNLNESTPFIAAVLLIGWLPVALVDDIIFR